MPTATDDEIPAVSVVMPVWRPDPRYFPAAVESILRQTLSDLELIIVEDPSECSASDVLRRIDDPRLRYIRNDSRSSFVEQVNRGVALARGELVARFDADDISEPQRLEKQKEFLDTNREIGIVGCQLLIIDEDDRVIGIRRYPTHPAGIRSAFRRFNPIAHPGAMFRKTLVDEHGGLTPGSNGVARDYAWFSVMAASGVRFANLPERLVRYRLHSSAMKHRKLRETARTTWEVKREIWWREMTPSEKLLAYAERVVTLLPPRLVVALFRRARLEEGSETISSARGPRNFWMRRSRRGQ